MEVYFVCDWPQAFFTTETPAGIEVIDFTGIVINCLTERTELAIASPNPNPIRLKPI